MVTPSSKPQTTAVNTGTNARQKAAASVKKAAPVVVVDAAPMVSAPEMKKVELVDAVVERSGIKKKFAKPAIEAALAILGEALSEGRDLNLRPLGKVKVQRSKEVANAQVLTARIRRTHMQEKTENEGIAGAVE